MWCSDACGALIGFEVRPWMHTEYVVDYQFGVPSHVCGEVMSRCIYQPVGLECFALALFYVIKLCPWYDSSPDPSIYTISIVPVKELGAVKGLKRFVCFYKDTEVKIGWVKNILDPMLRCLLGFMWLKVVKSFAESIGYSR